MEPIAIIGMACRFPGADSLEGFWRLLRDGVDAIREVPPDRWDFRDFPDASRWGGFLERVDAFDPAVFGISPREAAYMDPQQRLLLEVAWEALEDAGLPLEECAGRPVGVFMGISTYDYAALHLADAGRAAEGYGNTGGALSIAANRISYLFDLQGPSLAVDTACSSSLTATDLACRSLWRGESTVALAGGVNVILSPAITIAFSRLKAMAADGRCKTFDARADGYVRGEGAGVVVLKPLAAARCDGDRVYAVIRGSAVNQDGRTNGLTAPNGPSQEALIREALRSADVEPARVGYVEAHGTGTPLGDPIELNALGAALAPGRAPGQRCAVGSVKTNIGHLEAAAGIAGLIKLALALDHGEIPPSLHFQTPNPHIPFDTLPLAVQTARSAWPEDLRPAIAGLSSFGFGGTNVHLILEEPPPREPRAETASGERAELTLLSARTPEALRASAQALRAVLGDDAAPALPDVAYTLARRRSQHEHRLCSAARSREELRDHLQAFVAGEPRPGLAAGRAARGRRRKLAFVFPGQGSQWFGMARGLLAGESAFRDAVERCAAAIQAQAGWSLLDELHADADRSPLSSVDRIQPAIWAIQVGLAALWRSWGITPDAVVGHSMGEVAAAHVAGALGLDDAAAVICRRSRLLRRTSGQGAMAAVELSIEQAEAALAGFEDKVSIAASNSPTSTILSGDPAALEEILRALEGRSVFCRRVKVDVASHSPQMDPLRSELLEALRGLRPAAPAVALYSTVTGDPARDLPFDAAYWVRNLREPVLFSRAVERLAADGHTLFVELSPHPILLAGVQQTLQQLGKDGTVLASLRREEDERSVMFGSLGALAVAGRPVDWRAVAPATGRPVRLPAYAWQRERFWLDPSPGRHGASRSGHPLIGEHFVSAVDGTHYWEVDLGLEALPYLGDHRVQGSVVLPAAATLEMALAAAHEAFGPGPHRLEAMEFKRAVLIPDEGTQRVQLVLGRPGSGTSSFKLFALAADHTMGGGAEPHVTGAVRLAPAAAPVTEAASTPPAEVQARCTEPVAAADHYRAFVRHGLQYGPAFRGVGELWRRDGEAIARLRVPKNLPPDTGGHAVHLALLDACFQVLGAAVPRGADGRASEPYVPVALAGLSAHERIDTSVGLWGHAVLAGPSNGSASAASFQGDVFLLDDAGRVVSAARGLRVSRLDGTAATTPGQARDDWFYEVRWEAAALPAGEPAAGAAPAGPPGSWLVFADGRGVGDALRTRLEAQGAACVTVTCGESFAAPAAGRFQVRADEADDYRRVLAEPALHEHGPLRGVAHLWALDGRSLQTPGDVACLSAARLVQALAASTERHRPRLWLVTAGTQAVGSVGPDLALEQAPMWGLGRTIAHEHPELRCTNVDLGTGEATEAAALDDEIRRDDRETQVALRNGRRHVARLARTNLAAAPPHPGGPARRAGAELGPEQNFSVQIETPGILDHLGLRPATRTSPGAGQVEIRVHAAGLNFLDVLGALGLRPDLSGGSPPLGAECAGRITALGEGVEGLAVGDEVMAIAPASFSAFVTTDASLVAPVPAGFGFEEAATIPIAFLTADYALRHLGRLQRGERVLIHAAAGGVGLAALQLAQHIGAEVFATAGSPEKRALLESLGVRHVMDSRSLEFAAEVMNATGGEGVDVVLNSLAGEAIPRSLSVLRAYGRFLEIGKRDIYEDRALGLRPFQNNLSYFAVDLNRVVRERPALAGARLRRLARAFAGGTLTALPRRVFPVSDAASAFRFMAQARHVGKVVLDVQDPEARRLAAAARALRSDGTYLVTGGLGGLGLVVARWMVAQGARRLVLLGRSDPSPEAREAILEMQEAGATVLLARADVSDGPELAAALAEVREPAAPLRGVVHAAGRLDDRIVAQLDLAHFTSVMKPKVEGAWNLHRQTADEPLDFFVLFSSAASVLGSPGQGNYAAANAYLDALAHERRRQGQPGLTINWGPWAEVGLAARPDRGGRLAGGGMQSLTPAEGAAALGRVLKGEAAQVAVMPVDWSTLGRLSPTLATAPMVAALVASGAGPGPEDTPAAGSVAAIVFAAAPADRLQLLEAHLQQQVARVLRLPAAKLDVNRPLNTLGIDSLTAVELKNRIEGELKVSLPLLQLVQGPSVAELAALLLGQMEGGDAAPSAPKPTARAKGDSLLLSLLSLGEDERNA
jgi:acyl transferase domain-containing protein/acyl carrier protein